MKLLLFVMLLSLFSCFKNAPLDEKALKLGKCICYGHEQDFVAIETYPGLYNIMCTNNSFLINEDTVCFETEELPEPKLYI